MLHVTNGDSAAVLIRKTGIGGHILAWQDVLHIGPVPGGLSMDALSRRRADFLSSLGWGEKEELFRDFVLRDSTLQVHADGGQIVLWFEHDLYDQLQLVQILARLAEMAPQVCECFLICIDRYPGVSSFRGLGDLNPEQMTHLFDTRRPITSEQFSVAISAWDCFTSSDPARHQAFADTAHFELPFLQDAYRRFLQEWPSMKNGLSRTEEHALGLIVRGVHDPVELLRAHWENEEAPFMGDATFWEILQDLARGTSPLIHVEGCEALEDFRSVRIRSTLEGTAVLYGDEDAVTLRGIDRWYGGYHAVGHESIPRWDSVKRRLTIPESG